MKPFEFRVGLSAQPLEQDARDRPRNLRRRRFRALDAAGFCVLPICVAKTQYSFSDDPTRLGAPTGFTVTVKDVGLRAGAGFVVALMGDIWTMPGLPRNPAAERFRIVDGEIEGLF